MSTIWTKEQQQAIDTRGCNLLVAAAAGSGKTAVLVERIIKIVTNEKEPIDIDRLLVVTFTNAAASEMRERVGDAIGKALEKNPQSKQLQRQLTLLNKASITTIHSFCLDVIKNNFHKLDLDPNFRIADETEAILLKQEVLEELFEERYEVEKCSESFLTLVECYGGSRDDQQLQEMVLSLYQYVKSCPWPDQWLDDAANNFLVTEDFNFGESIWAQILVRDISIELQGLDRKLRQAIQLIENAPELEPYLPAFRKDAATLEELREGCTITWEKLREIFASLSFEKLGRCGKDADKELQKKVQDIRNGIKKRLNAIGEEAFSWTREDIMMEFSIIYPLMQELGQLVKEFDRKFSLKKKEKGLIDFNDFEHFCLKVLVDREENGETRPSTVALALREKYAEILIDEYQDSNHVQETILTTISRKDSEVPNIFMVGDVKQSIYRFRQAKPELFLQKYNSYHPFEGRERKILLYKNFRSREEILDCTNYIFKLIMSEAVGELDYTDSEALNLGADYRLPENFDGIAGGPIELHLIEKQKEEIEVFDQEEDEEETVLIEEDLDSIQLEGRVVAKRIRELVTGKSGSFKVYDKTMQGYRPVEYRDIVILLRATSNWAPVFAEELGQYDIPVYADIGTGYFDTTEIKTVLSLLQIIDNPMQDIPLLAVLRSTIASFTPEELVDIRSIATEVSFYEVLKRTVDPGEEAELSKEKKIETILVEKVKNFLQRLTSWRKKAAYMSTSELLWFLYTDTGYYGYAGAMPGGPQRQANLRVLFERARQYEETSYKGLFNFINFIDKLKYNSGDMGSAKTLGESDNVVRMMSIHKSKGLEFPVVIVAGMGKNFNLQDTKRSILFHHDLGFGPEFVDPLKRISYPSIAKQALKKKIILESLSEEMRVLYVALTRAKEKLILTGAVNDMVKTVSKWALNVGADSKLPAHEVLSSKSYLDWVGTALMKHPQSTPLRKLIGIEEMNEALVNDPSQWEIRFWNRSGILVEQQVEETEKVSVALEEKVENEKYRAEIERRLSWRYLYEKATKLPTKLSVTEIKRRLQSEYQDEFASTIFAPVQLKKPLFLEKEKGLSAAERGTVMHLVMQCLKISEEMGTASLRKQIEGMVEKELLTEEQAKVIRIPQIQGFYQSELGKRMQRAEVVRREVPFYMEINSTEIWGDLDKDIYSNERVLIQGIIDCYFEEDGEIILVDYKTDYATEENMEDIKNRYEVQLRYYTKALEKITGKRVKEKVLYLFSNSKFITYN